MDEAAFRAMRIEEIARDRVHGASEIARCSLAALADYARHRMHDEEDELRRQIAEQDEKGFGGVMCHGRDGLRTAYLEREWEEALRVILDECEKRGMIVWLYDEFVLSIWRNGHGLFLPVIAVMLAKAKLRRESDRESSSSTAGVATKRDSSV